MAKKPKRKNQAKLWVTIVIIVVIVIALVAVFYVQELEEEVIKIGASFPLTGPIAKFGEWAKNGAELAVNEINTAGGVNGRLIKLIIEDDECVPKEATITTTKLIDIDNVDAIVVACSAAVPGATPVAENKAIIFTPSAKSEVVEGYAHLFSIEASMSSEMKELAEYIYNKLGLREISILYVSNDLGLSYKNNFEEEFTKIGGTIPIIETFALLDKDFRTQLTKIKNTDSEGLLVVMSGGGLGNILKQAEELGLELKYFGTTITESPVFLAVAGELAEGIIYAYPFKLGLTEKSQKFYDNYVNTYGEDPERMATNTYDAIVLTAKIKTKCGDNLECMIEEIKLIKDFEGASGFMTFDEGGNAIKNIYIKTVRNGEFVIVE